MGTSSSILGIALGGPVLRASSRAVNEAFDRHIDAAQTGTATPAGHAQGSGLGLSICRAIVTLPWRADRLDDEQKGHAGAPGLRIG